MAGFLDVVPHKLVLKPCSLSFRELRVLGSGPMADLKPLPAALASHYVHHHVRPERGILATAAHAPRFSSCVMI